MAAHKSNDAERAAIIAAILDFEIGTRTIDACVHDRRSEKILARENVAHENLSMVRRSREQVRDFSLMRVADHPFHSRHGGQLFRGSLGITAGHQNAPLRILTMNAADGL